MVATKLKYIQKINTFLDMLDNGSISNEDIVFIEETLQIWTHNKYFSNIQEIERELNKYCTKQELTSIIDAIYSRKLDRNFKINDHTVDGSDITLTKSDVGLGNVTNESKATMFTSPTFTGVPKAPTPAATTNTTQIATTAFVQSAINNKLAANDAMLFKGVINSNSELPTTHEAGWTYKVGTAGTYVGKTCEIGDMILCITDGTSSNNTHWTILQNNIDGAVTGPTTSTDAHIAVFDGTSGKIIKDSNASLSSYYTKEEVDTLGNQLKAIAEARVPIDSFNTWSETVATKEEVAAKADKSTVYTKTESDGKYQAKGNYLTEHQDISGKVDKVAGKGLSTNDYTAADKAKVDDALGKSEFFELPNDETYGPYLQEQSFLNLVFPNELYHNSDTPGLSIATNIDTFPHGGEDIDFQDALDTTVQFINNDPYECLNTLKVCVTGDTSTDYSNTSNLVTANYLYHRLNNLLPGDGINITSPNTSEGTLPKISVNSTIAKKSDLDSLNTTLSDQINTVSNALTNYVTTDTDQTITGIKTFADHDGNTIVEYTSNNDTIYTPAEIYLTGNLETYGDIETYGKIKTSWIDCQGNLDIGDFNSGSTSDVTFYSDNVIIPELCNLKCQYEQMDMVSINSQESEFGTPVKFYHTYVDDSNNQQKDLILDVDSQNNKVTVKSPLECSSEISIKNKPISPRLVPNGGKENQILSWESDGKAKWTNLSSMFTGLEELLAYGVEWDVTVADPHLTRIGNMSLHKTLPIQSQLKGCIAQGPKIMYWLDEDDWNLKQGTRVTYTHTYEATNVPSRPLKVGDTFYIQNPSFLEDGKWIHFQIQDNTGDASCQAWGQVNMLDLEAMITIKRIVSNSATNSTITWDDNIHTNAIATPSRLDGYDGTVRVYCPAFYIKSQSIGNKRRVWLSTVKIDDTWTYQPEILIDAYRSTVLNTVPANMGYLSTLPVDSAISVVNTASYCRGGNNNPTYDKYLTGEGNTTVDIFRTNLGKPRTYLSRPVMRSNARSGRGELLSYDQYKNIFYWLYVVEYANFNCQEAYNATLTTDGYRQGGLGNGVTNVSNADAFNSHNPITPCGYGNDLGNGTGVKLITSPGLTPANGVYMCRWRGFDNPFGDISTNLDGIIIDADVDNHPNGMNYVYTCQDPNKYADDLNGEGYEKVGEEARFNGYTKLFDLGDSAHIIPNVDGGDATKYKCDGHQIGASTSVPITLTVGHNQYSATTGGLGYFRSHDSVQLISSDTGYRTVTPVVYFPDNN